MIHEFITVVIPFSSRHAGDVTTVVRSLTDAKGGNEPAKELDDAITKLGIVHFMSITVVEPRCPSEPPSSSEKDHAHLLVEISSDRSPEETLASLALRLGAELQRILVAARLTLCEESLEAYLLRHSRKIGAAWGSDALGQIHSGTPGMTVKRIRDEEVLAARAGALFNQFREDPDWHRTSPRQRLERMRNRFWDEGEWKWAFVPEPTPVLAGDPHNKWRPEIEVSNPQARKAFRTILHDLLWPLYIPLLVVAATVIALTWHDHVELNWTTHVSLGLATGLLVALTTLLGAALEWPRRALIALALLCAGLLAYVWDHGPLAELLRSGEVVGGLFGGFAIAIAAVFAAGYGRLRELLVCLGVLAVLVALWWYRGPVLAFLRVGGLSYWAVAGALGAGAIFAGKSSRLRCLLGVLVPLILLWAYRWPILDQILLTPAGIFWVSIGGILALATISGAYPRLWWLLIGVALLAPLWQYSDPILETLRNPHLMVWLTVALLAAASALTGRLWLRLLLIVTAAIAVYWWHAVLVSKLLWILHVVAGLVVAFLAAIIAFFALGVLRLRHLERTDKSEDVTPPSHQVEKLMSLENFCAQNHLASVSRLKPGLVRRLTLRIAFMVVGTGRFVGAPGFLGKNGVIHFARWMRIPGTSQLLFFSNYDNTWQSYVGDFIADAPTGVTAIWSNCTGFPRTRSLYEDGAQDRDRLVRWARRQQQPTWFWYRAYGNLTAERIRVNAAIRQGLASAESDADARDWFSLFGARPRPQSELQSTQIPTLVFGGLSGLPHAQCHVIAFGQNAGSAECREWLRAAAEEAAYGEMLPGQKSATVVALSATGLAKLGLPAEAIETFPAAFQQGMWPEWRARMLGDECKNAPDQWDWGFPPGGKRADVFLVVYGLTEEDMERASCKLMSEATRLKHDVIGRPLKMAPLIEKAGGRKFLKEPFGFADGISQPVIRGTKRATSNVSPHDLVAPGELILGYPDNLGRVPPSPSIEDRHDAGHLLPDATVQMDPPRTLSEFSRYHGDGRRDLGANGTFLVVRQLQQHVREFETWLDDALKQIENDAIVASDGMQTAIEWGNSAQDRAKESPLPRPRRNLLQELNDRVVRERVKDAIAAKLIGRWKDGTSLVRYPLMPGTEQDRSAKPDNDFLPGAEDPVGFGCPFGAHIRRANPRDTRIPGSLEEVATTNRHRILRVGRVYGEPHPAKPGELDPKEPQGLLFMCVNADIERQFEFIQKTWLLNRNLHGLENEADPIIGHGARIFTLPTPTGPVLLKNFPDVVTVKGGGYFFLPGRAVLRYLSAPL